VTPEAAEALARRLDAVEARLAELERLERLRATARETERSLGEAGHAAEEVEQ
jgi:hypothetical protein